MSGSSDQPTQKDLAAMEAASWFVSNRVSASAGGVDDFDSWLSAHSANERAYASAEAIWSDLDTILAQDKGPAAASVSPPPGFMATGIGRWATLGAACVALLLATVFFLRPGGEMFSTEIGGQQIAVLDDGTRVSLNTATRLEVSYGKERRAVRFDHGEALFDVARDPSRPFVVAVDDYHVTALGTSFVIRSDAKGSWVTLIEGSVRVTGTGAGETVLRPGERLILTRDATRIDRPELDKLTAWRRGELVFDRTPLPEAVYEINRYTDTPIVVKDPAARSRHVTGSFRVHRSEEFAKSIAALYGLQAEYREDSIVLERPR